MADQISEDDILGMSDDEMVNLPIDPELIPSSQGKSDIQTDPQTPNSEDIPVVESDDPPVVIEEGAAEDKPEVIPEEEDENVLGLSDEEISKTNKPKEKEKKSEEKPEDKAKEPQDKSAGKADEEVKTPADPSGSTPVDVDYKAAYDKLMTPFRASNQTIKLNNIDEAIVLMQHGADYTKKMKALAPNLKMMRMLENNGLLNEEKLTLFIDLEKNDPAAVNKFLKDKNIDPFDLDPEEGKSYKPGNHRVSDEEMRFTNILDDVKSTPEGRETIAFIDKNWDQDSINVLFHEPELMKLFDSHRADGLLDQIVSELEHRKVLGKVPENISFLQAYKAIGDELHTSGRLTVNGVPTNRVPDAAVAPTQNQKPQSAVTPPVQPTRQVIATRTPTTKPVVSNDAKARAAAPTRQNSTKPNAIDFNPLSMSDEEFEKTAGSFRI